MLPVLLILDSAAVYSSEDCIMWVNVLNRIYKVAILDFEIEVGEKPKVFQKKVSLNFTANFVHNRIA